MGSQLVRTSFALESSGESIHVVPPGPVVVARDQRMFQINDAARVVAKSETPMLVDWEHNSERYDGSTRAAGWVTALELSDGTARAAGIWGRVQWTPQGKVDVDTKAYRFLSPVLELDSETREVLSIISVALTNKPALGQLAAIGEGYRERVRIACSVHAAGTRDAPPDVPPGVRELLRAKGFSDERIADVVKFQAEQREALFRGGRWKRLSPTATEAEIREQCMARGMTAEGYAAAKKDIEDRKARFYGK